MLWQRAGLLSEGGPWCLAARPHAEGQANALLRAGVDLALAGLSRYMPLMPPATSVTRRSSLEGSLRSA